MGAGRDPGWGRGGRDSGVGASVGGRKETGSPWSGSEVGGCDSPEGGARGAERPQVEGHGYPWMWE